MRRRVASIRNLSERRVSEICTLFAACSAVMHDTNALLDIYVTHDYPLIYDCLSTNSGFQWRRTASGR